MKKKIRKPSRTKTGNSKLPLRPAGAKKSTIRKAAAKPSKASRPFKGLPAGNPYGGVPGGGITYPPYYRPTAYLTNNNNYFAGTETLGEDEMRISFLGSTPFPV